MPKNNYFLLPKEHLSERFFKEKTYSYCEEHFVNLQNHFPLKNLLPNGNIPWMVKGLYGTIDANKESSFFNSAISGDIYEIIMSIHQKSSVAFQFTLSKISEIQQRFHFGFPFSHDITYVALQIQTYTLKTKDSLLASTVPRRTFNTHATFPFHKRFFTVEKGSFDY